MENNLKKKGEKCYRGGSAGVIVLLSSLHREYSSKVHPQEGIQGSGATQQKNAFRMIVTGSKIQLLVSQFFSSVALFFLTR